jgi:hypothetical protein
MVSLFACPPKAPEKKRCMGSNKEAVAGRMCKKREEHDG